MPDFFQHELITTIHDLRTGGLDQMEEMLVAATQESKVGLVLPVTASDMRAEPFDKIVAELAGADYVDTIVVTLGVAPDESDYQETLQKVASLGSRCKVLWTDGPKVQGMYDELIDAGIPVNTPGKGRSVWTAFGYLLADPSIEVFALHDCDIVDYDRTLLSRLCLPMVHPALDFEFCKAYYARVTDRMHGRVVRLLVAPLLRALMKIYPSNRFVHFLANFRYPLSGEFSLTRNLARTNRIPSDWGLEVGTLAEVFRNTSLKRVCQADLCRLYEHKHQDASLHNKQAGLMKMATDILTTIYRTLASQGVILGDGAFITLRSLFLRTAQDCIRQYAADARVNGLDYDRHGEETMIDAFATCITTAAEVFRADPNGAEAIPNWSRVRAAFPDFVDRLRDAT
ncbi:glycosyltransferase family protein [Roseiconus lacunae]|uniref:Glycosyl transferase n=1 Tax=Roseiconus lacunae TaxID=2605694 RepID=A0ABT7PCP8_9BACT|nr:glycosyl transferase [Roseiconus lacunae]MCD0461625.1 glycosyl transferase [Roseiconus lacunae]MDM4014274.1 glycosyl transferase [Roseiconus lacunae]WRQ49592.1 glycosyl transferase [Stieleria sp. HD01]